LENQLNQIIREKEKELDYIKKELAGALLANGDPDYEYAFHLSSIRWSVEYELKRLDALQVIRENKSTTDFKSYIEVLLSDQRESLEFHISIGEQNFYNYNGPLLQISRIRKRSLKCNLTINDRIRAYLPHSIDNEMKNIGWKQRNKKSPFTKVYVIKSKEDISDFHVFIAKTLLEPYGHLIKKIKEQYYILK
jgi:hypothetical protein